MGILEVSELRKYFGEVKAVDDISFEVRKGEIFGLLGPNGAGKSTTISMIATLLKPDNGDIAWKKGSIVKKPSSIQSVLGYVPQEVALYPVLSGRENLVFFGKAYGLKGQLLKDRIDEIARVIGIEDRLKDKVKTYSGGMKRRLNIGVALLHKPEIIIMDEPTVGIDPQSRSHILETVKKLRDEGMTVIYTSHYMEEVEYLCDYISIMDMGKIIASGTKDELIEGLDERQEMVLRLQDEPVDMKSILMSIDTVQEVIAENGTYRLLYERDNGIFEKVISATSSNGTVILGMDVVRANLETVFLRLTGRELRD